MTSIEALELVWLFGPGRTLHLAEPHGSGLHGICDKAWRGATEANPKGLRRADAAQIDSLPKCKVCVNRQERAKNPPAPTKSAGEMLADVEKGVAKAVKKKPSRQVDNTVTVKQTEPAPAKPDTPQQAGAKAQATQARLKAAVH
jgi:hypothetical protein